MLNLKNLIITTFALQLASACTSDPPEPVDACREVALLYCERDLACGASEERYEYCLRGVDAICALNTRQAREDHAACVDAWQNDSRCAPDAPLVEVTPFMAACFGYYAHDGYAAE